MKALERVGLADRVDFQPNQLSGWTDAVSCDCQGNRK